MSTENGRAPFDAPLTPLSPRAPRRRATGIATLSAKDFSAECELVDVSVGGAKVKLPDDQPGPLPEYLLFEERSFNRSHIAQVRWRAGSLVGLSLKTWPH